MAAWSAWFDDVLPDVPRVSQPLAEFDIKRAVIEFCERSRVLRARGFIDDPGGLAIRTFPTSLVPTTRRVLAIERGKYGGSRLDPIGPEKLASLYPDWTVKEGQPLYTFRDRAAVQTNGFHLVPAPAAATTGTLWLEVSLCPKESVATIDDYVFDEFRSAIAHGAKALLLARPRKPWTSLELAGDYRMKFNQAIESARIKADAGADRPKMVTKPHPF